MNGLRESVTAFGEDVPNVSSHDVVRPLLRALLWCMRVLSIRYLCVVLLTRSAICMSVNRYGAWLYAHHGDVSASGN